MKKWLFKLVESQERYDRIVAWGAGTVALLAIIMAIAVFVVLILTRSHGGLQFENRNRPCQQRAT